MDELKQNENLIAAIEGILFVYGEPLAIDRITKVLSGRSDFKKVKKADVKAALEKLAVDLSKEESRGLKLIFSESEGGDRVQLATKPELADFLEDFVKEEFKESLSPASLEALSLIAYLGPMSRAEIDYYRGVNSSFILRSLLIRGLVNRFPDSKRSNVFLYQASFELIKFLGLSRIEDLPEYQKFRESSRKF